MSSTGVTGTPDIASSPPRPLDTPPVRRSWGSFLWLAAPIAILGFAAVQAWMDPNFMTPLRESAVGSGKQFWHLLSTEIVLNPWFYGVFISVLVLEQLVPAQQSQRRWSSGLRSDAVWIGVSMAAKATILPLYVVALRLLYGKYLGFLTIQSVAAWPWAAKVLLALFVEDLLFWVTHVVRHKVPALWYFHAVHHSQKELNFFTDYRVHPVDDFFIFTIGILPLLMVQAGFTTIVAVVWIRHWHTRIYHSNIRSNFGWLRYLLVTPQSHRIHHSIEPRHHDRNFGLTFSVWDQIFGTQYRGWNEYPQTGISDADFPFEQSGSTHHQLETLIGQLFYPFRALAR